MSEEKQKTILKGKQKLFADFYVGDALFNGTKAARLAQYEGDNNTLAVTASRLLRNAKVSQYIEDKLAVYAMGVNETIARLAEIARGDVDDVLDEEGKFSLKVARENNKTHLLKKIKTKRTIKQSKTEPNEEINNLLSDDEIEPLTKQTEIIYEEVEFEMYSAHEAQRDIGKIHKLFTEKIESDVNLTSSVVRVPPKQSPEEWSEQYQPQSEK
ncbi:MAG: terminase small subunit [Bacteroidetes bacterium]|nr:terminase small subunit [Bacteroidota bacterium]